MKSLFVFLGAPGSGKGSLARLCIEQLGWIQLSTGDLCRKHIAEQTEIGKKIDFAIKSGKLVADSLIAEMVRDWFQGRDNDTVPVILDGFPRTVAQAEYFHDFLSKKNGELCFRVIRFVIADEQLVERLSRRLICQNKQCQAIFTMTSDMQQQSSLVCAKCGSVLMRREDDQPEVVQKRLAEYYKHEQGLLNFYQSIGQPVVELIVDKPLLQVFEEFKNIVDVHSA